MGLVSLETLINFSNLHYLYSKIPKHTFFSVSNHTDEENSEITPETSLPHPKPCYRYPYWPTCMNSRKNITLPPQKMVNSPFSHLSEAEARK